MHIPLHSPSSWVVDIGHSPLANQRLKVITMEDFCKHISKLISSGNKESTNKHKKKFLFYKMPINLNMLSIMMLNWIMGDADSGFIITVMTHRSENKKTKLSKKKTYLYEFTYPMSHRTILSLST